MKELILSICYTIMIAGCILAVKNHVTYKMHKKIIDVIFMYQMSCLMKEDLSSSDLVIYEDMESYDATLFRIWDWGYKRILPPEKFALVEPFIK